MIIPEDFNHQHKGYAYVELNNEVARNRAVSSLKGQKICRREIKIELKRTNIPKVTKMEKEIAKRLE